MYWHVLYKGTGQYMPTYSRFLDSMHYISFRKINFVETKGVWFKTAIVGIISSVEFESSIQIEEFKFELFKFN
jgi:hypothetical protein